MFIKTIYITSLLSEVAKKHNLSLPALIISFNKLLTLVSYLSNVIGDIYSINFLLLFEFSNFLKTKFKYFSDSL